VALEIWRESLSPGFAGSPSFRRGEEVLERHVHERDPRFGEQLVGVPELASHVHAAPLFLLDERAAQQRPVDRHGPAVAQKDPPGDDREAVPRREQAADLVQESGDHPAVRETRPALVPLVERERRLVAVGALLLGMWQVEADRVVAAPEAGRVVVRRDLQRIPPRSKCALKKFSEPEVAMAAEAEISSARVAAATI
jgi:hypothetical protein